MTKDRLKEEIGLFKLLMTITSAIDGSLTSWLFNNSDSVLSTKLIIVFVITLIFLVATIFFLIKIINKIEELE